MRIATWIITGLLALAFVGAGLAKLTAQPTMVAEFGVFGLPLWFMYLTGTLEIISAVLVLVPRLAVIGAGLICCIMVGALLAHLSHGQFGPAAVPFVLLVLAAVLGRLRGWGQRGQRPLRNAA